MSDKKKITILRPVSRESAATLNKKWRKLDANRINAFPGTVAVFQYREWSDEYRLTFKTEPPGMLPPIQSGKRKTEFLSAHAARQLVASCEFVSMKHGGYSTFLTLTFDDEARERLANGATIQGEVSRFFDGLQKIYKRGFIYRGLAEGKRRVEGHDNNLQYLWVAENPKNAKGDDNPHVHVLLNWRVEYRYFETWAARVEKLWRQGFAHLEKLKSKNREAAAGYLMKALEYLKKSAGGSDQGVIFGNRYGIAECARAPGWEFVHSYAWHIAGQLIEKARLVQRRKLKPLEQKREQVKEALTAATDKKAKNKLRAILAKTREKITQTKGQIYYGRNNVVCSGEKAANKLFGWLKKMGWVGLDKPLSLYGEILRRKAEKLKSEYDRWHKNVVDVGWWESLKINDDLSVTFEG